MNYFQCGLSINACGEVNIMIVFFVLRGNAKVLLIISFAALTSLISSRWIVMMRPHAREAFSNTFRFWSVSRDNIGTIVNNVPRNKPQCTPRTNDLPPSVGWIKSTGEGLIQDPLNFIIARRLWTQSWLGYRTVAWKTFRTTILDSRRAVEERVKVFII